MKKFILASGSPRRKDILEREGYSFTAITSDKEGVNDGFTSPEKLAVLHAAQKAQDVFDRFGEGTVVLGADTVVASGGKTLGKAKSSEEAREMLRSLSGKSHEVYTGYALISADMRETGSVKTTVTFNELSEKTVDDYIKSGLWQGKAGAYGIQDGFDLVKSYEGDYDNVVGLPIKQIEESIKEFLK